MECDQLFLAAKEGNIATMEILIYDKYVDVNSRTQFEDDCMSQVCTCMYSNYMVAIYVHAYESSVTLKV